MVELLKEHVLILLICIFFIFAFIKKKKTYRFIGTDKRIFDSQSIGKDVIERYARSKEERCRRIFQTLFKVPFKKQRPSFLKNPKTGRNLELDGFNANIVTPKGRGVAFEYNGSQHYVFRPQYHASEEDFENQQNRDVLKRKLCKENGVILFSIPYTIEEKNLYYYIKHLIFKNELYAYL